MRVRDALYEWMRRRDVRYVFGNPGSTEIPMLTDLPGGVRYVLALHEACAVAMADGYAQGARRPAFVNLHAAPGLGNAVGALFTARKNRAPMVVTVGQQDTRHLHREPLLAADLVAMAAPAVKWAAEAREPEHVVPLVERAWAVAQEPPAGPAVVSIPMNFWDVECGDALQEGPDGGRQIRRVGGTRWGPRGEPDGPGTGAGGAGEGSGSLEAVLDAPGPVALVVGAGVDRAGPEAWRAVGRLAERTGWPVYGEPLAPRAGFATDHPLWRGYLLPGAPLIARELAAFRTVVVVGAPVFLLYPYLPGPAVPPGTAVYLLTDDPEEAARAPVRECWVGDLAALAEELARMAGERRRAAGGAEAAAGQGPARDQGQAEQARARRRAEAARGRARMEPAFVMHTLAKVMEEAPGGPPGDPARAPVVVDEASLASLAVREYLPVRGPSGYFSAASGGLGWGVPAAVGLKLALPERPVVAVVGDGSLMFGIHGLWSAARLGAAVKFVVLNNEGYGILKAFARTFYPGAEERLPGLDLPGLRLAELARSMGVEAERVETPEALEVALRRAVTYPDPYLVDVRVSRAVKSLV